MLTANNAKNETHLTQTAFKWNHQRKTWWRKLGWKFDEINHQIKLLKYWMWAPNICYYNINHHHHRHHHNSKWILMCDWTKFYSKWSIIIWFCLILQLKIYRGFHFPIWFVSIEFDSTILKFQSEKRNAHRHIPIAAGCWMSLCLDGTTSSMGYNDNTHTHT